MLNGCSIKAFEGWLSDLVRKNYHFDCIFDCWRVTIVEKHIRQLPLVTKILVFSSLVLGLVKSELSLLVPDIGENYYPKHFSSLASIYMFLSSIFL